MRIGWTVGARRERWAGVRRARRDGARRVRRIAVHGSGDRAPLRGVPCAAFEDFAVPPRSLLVRFGAIQSPRTATHRPRRETSAMRGRTQSTQGVGGVTFDRNPNLSATRPKIGRMNRRHAAPDGIGGERRLDCADPTKNGRVGRGRF
jgi:hypothetical protein